jgi:hypothetical protein
VAHWEIKNKTLKLGMHSQLINMDLQEGMVIKNIYNIYTYTFQNICMGYESVIDKYLRWPHVNVTV